MIVVSGTKRSGTSMWMQVFAACGLTIVGDAFPRNWGDNALRAANPEGFYESILRDGIYFATNPHPGTGQYFLPEQARRYVAKIFIPGLVRTERAYIEYAVANMRHWKDYEASVARLWALDDEARQQRAPNAPAPFRVPAVLEWWIENYALARDIYLRNYPACIFTYDRVLVDPVKYVGEVLDDLEVRDREAAFAAIKPQHRTTQRPESTSVEPDIAQAFDDFFAAVDESEDLSDTLMKKLDQTHAKLMPQLRRVKRDLFEWMVSVGISPPGLLPNV